MRFSLTRISHRPQWLLALFLALPAGHAAQAQTCDTPEKLAKFWAPTFALETGNRMVDFPVMIDRTTDLSAVSGGGRSLTRDLHAGVHWWYRTGDHHRFLGYALSWADTQLEPETRWLYVVVDGVSGCSHLTALWVPDEVQPGLRGFETDGAPEPEQLAKLWSERSGGAAAREPAARKAATHDVDFIADDFGWHPVVFVSARTHQFSFQSLPNSWSPGPVEDWRRRNWIEERDTKGSYKYPGGGPSRERSAGAGIVIHYEGVSELIQPRQVRGQGTIKHHWEIVGYELYPIDELLKVFRSGERPKLFDQDGFYAGSRSRAKHQLPPWLTLNENGRVIDSSAFLEPGKSFLAP